MKVISKCLSFALLFALSFTALYPYSYASAASSYDTAVQTTSDMIMQHQGFSCNVDLSTSWVEKAKLKLDPSLHAKVDFIASQTYQAVYFNDKNGDTGTSWRPERMHITGSSESGAYTHFNTTNVYAVHPKDKLIFEFNSSGCEDENLIVQYQPTEGGELISDSNGSYRVVWSTYPVTYPTGYEGQTIPQSYELPPAPIFDLSFEVFDKEMTIQASLKEDTGNLADYTCEYNIDMNPALESDADIDEALYTPIPCDTAVTHVWEEYGTYYVSFVYRNTGGDSETLAEVLTVDGTYISGNFNKDDGLTIKGQETCSITQLGGCTRNVLYHLMGALGMTQTSKNPSGSPFMSFTTEDHGGLTSIITSPIAILSNLQSSYDGCNPVVIPLPYVQKDLTLPCLAQFYENSAGLFLWVYQTIISGIIAYYVMLQLFAMVKGFKDPQNDKIEATAL